MNIFNNLVTNYIKHITIFLYKIKIDILNFKIELNNKFKILYRLVTYLFLMLNKIILINIVKN